MGHPTLVVTVYAKNDILIGAYAYSCTWQHVFFEDKLRKRELEVAYSQRYQENVNKRRLETLERDLHILSQAFTEHKDVFRVHDVQQAEPRVRDPGQQKIKVSVAEVFSGSQTSKNVILTSKEKISSTSSNFFMPNAVFVFRDTDDSYWCMSEDVLQQYLSQNLADAAKQSQ